MAGSPDRFSGFSSSGVGTFPERLSDGELVDPFWSKFMYIGIYKGHPLAFIGDTD